MNELSGVCVAKVLWMIWCGAKPVCWQNESQRCCEQGDVPLVVEHKHWLLVKLCHVWRSSQCLPWTLKTTPGAGVCVKQMIVGWLANNKGLSSGC